MPSSPSERSRQALADILENASLAQAFIAKMTYKEFVSIVRLPTRPPDLSKLYPRQAGGLMTLRAIAWRLALAGIAGAGNIYRHGYDVVAEDLVWRTVNDEIPKIIHFAEIELNATGENG
jgi:uncharacterized protein with HEPN domain